MPMDTSPPFLPAGWTRPFSLFLPSEIACALLEERISTMSENLDHLKSRYQELVAEQQELSKSE